MALHSNLSFSLHPRSSKSSTLAPALSNPSSFPLRLSTPFPRFPGVKIAPKEQKQHSKRIRIGCNAKPEAETQSLGVVKERSVSVILLAGGKGKRMGASMPKQYIPLLGQPIALYSFFTFSLLREVKEIVVVCDPTYKDIFEDASQEIQVNLKFASPGKERQDSVFNGFQEIDGRSELVCIHDSARPLVSTRDIEKGSYSSTMLLSAV